LIALDQMGGDALTRDLVTPLLDTDDPDLQQTALDVMSRHEGWSSEIRSLVQVWLSTADLSDGQRAALSGSLLALSADADMQQLISDALLLPATPPENRRLLFNVIARCHLPQLPKGWLEALALILASTDHTLQREVVATVQARNLDAFDAALAALASRSDVPAELRVAALDAIAPRQPGLSGDVFALLTAHVASEVEPLLRVAAARALGASRLTGDQLLELIPHLTAAGPLTLPLLMPAFSHGSDRTIGLALVTELKKSGGATALSSEELRRLIQYYPAEVYAAAEPLLAKLAAREQEQEAYLADLVSRTIDAPGNPERGRHVFFSKKVGCYGCHRIDGKGGSVGPDLSQIGRIRDPRALLEAIVFPSSTIVPEYRTYSIATRSGVVEHGMIVRESADAIYLRTAHLAEIRIARSEVEELRPSDVSLMPQGLEKTMTAEEFADLLEFLFQRR
jgi:putative heme-binding domain-containing protein